MKKLNISIVDSNKDGAESEVDLKLVKRVKKITE